MSHEGEGSWYKGQSRTQAESATGRLSNSSQFGHEGFPRPLSSNTLQHRATNEPKPVNSATNSNVAEVAKQIESKDFNQQNIEAGHPISLPQLPTKKHESLPSPSSAPTVLESVFNIAQVQKFEAERELSLSRLECEKLHERVNELSGHLQNAQDIIFSLQPYQQEINESDAAAAYASLCKEVESWVAYNLGDAIEDRVIFKEGPFDSRAATDLLSLVSPAGKEAFSYSDTDEHNVIAAVMQFLINEIFDREFYCPIDARGMAFLASIASSMGSLVPHRDMATIRKWRSETLNALANRPDFDTHRANRIKQLSTSLVQMLHIFVPHADKEKLQASLQASIIERAIELAHKIQLSVDRFEVCWTIYAEGYTTHGGHSMPEPHHFECINLLAGGKALKFPLDKQIAEKEHTTYIFDICPGLHCWTIKADKYSEPRVLKKSKILVAVKNPNKGLSQLIPHSNPDMTLLGAIHSQLYPEQQSMHHRR